MKGIRRAAAVLLGFVFFIAGILKLMDPVGMGFLMESYFSFLHIGFLDSLAKALGVTFSLVETVLGAALVTGVWRKLFSAVTLSVLLFFTALTALMWFVDPPMDCGCFGEAFHLTHLQSLLKNIFLLILWVLAFAPLSADYPSCKKVKFATFSLSVLSICCFAAYSLFSIPLMDFTPFAPGVSLYDETSEGSPDEAPILSFRDSDGEYRDSLALSGPVLVFSVYDDIPLDDQCACAHQAASFGIRSIILVSGETREDAYISDRRTLMTLNRSNGGATFVKDGVIVAKWHASDLPDADILESLADEDPDLSCVKINNPRRLGLQGFLLYVFAVMLLL